MTALLAALNNRYVIYAMAFVVYSAWLGVAGYNTGRDWATARYERAATEERKLQAEANEAANKALANETLKYLRAQSALEDIMELNSREAQSDPGAATGGIGPDSVLRLNRIR